MLPRWLCACAPVRAADRDGAEHCRPFDPRPHAPDWLAPRQPDHNPRTDSPRPCEQSIAQLLCRSVAGPGFDVPAIHQICERRAFGTTLRWCREGGSRHLAEGLAAQSMSNLAELCSLDVGEAQAPFQLELPDSVFSNQILIP